jgi:hypothetical protein
MNVRIQRRRTKGWRMPPGAIYVGRPTVYGNPFTVARAFTELCDVMVPATDLMSRFVAVQAYRSWITAEVVDHTIDLELLRGHDLACWCPLDQPCHADVLLELTR